MSVQSRSHPPVAVRREDAVAVVTISAPPLNILTRTIKTAIREALERLAIEADIRAIVLTGQGERAFSAGADITEFPERIRDGNAREIAREGHALARSILFAPQPVIAAVNGLCLGGGCEVAICCDLRIADETARLGFPEVKRGVFPGNGGTQVLTHLVGAGRAKRLMWTGEQLTAGEALAIGLVDEVVSAGGALDAAQALARELAARPAVAVRSIKRLVGQVSRDQLEAGWEREAAAFGEVFRTEDVREGVRAFFEKREPRFRHG